MQTTATSASEGSWEGKQAVEEFASRGAYTPDLTNSKNTSPRTGRMVATWRGRTNWWGPEVLAPGSEDHSGHARRNVFPRVQEAGRGWAEPAPHLPH